MSEELEQIINEEAETNSLKNSDQAFIQQNYKKLSLEDLSLATDLPPDIIAEYITSYEVYLKKNGINPDNKFAFHMYLNSEGSVSYGLEWPDIKSIEGMLPFLGKFFYSMNSGQLKPSMTNFLARYAEEKGAYQIVKTIMTDWNNYITESKETPIVEPYEVFKE